MLTSILGVACVALAASLVGLLAVGGRWRRSGLFRCIAYGALTVLPAYLLGELGWRLPRGHLLAGCGLALLGIVSAFFLKRDWNPSAQAFFGTLGLTCLTFVVFSAKFTLSGHPAVAVPGGIVLIGLEVFAFALLLIGAHEVLDAAGRVRWRRKAGEAVSEGFLPFVSIHVPTHNEPPELVVQTLQALGHLDYPAYEVVVLDNNTDDEALWRPVERYCREVGFRFVHLEHWPGFKAGALNHGLRILDPRTEIVAVVDADFVVEPDFLAGTVGYFADPEVGIVQTAQDFRWEGEAPYFRRLALTYRAFDEVSMPSRNERNAIIFAGTMGLLRRSSIVEAGGWAEWSLTEDAELSVRVLARGYQALYVERVFGRGVMPLTFAALKGQRFRWCFGGIQILRRHWRLLVRGRDVAPDGTSLSLTPGQRYEYLVAGLQWFQPLLTLAFSVLLLIGVGSHALGQGLALRPLVGLFVAVPVLLLVSGVVKAVWGLRVRLQARWGEVLSVFGIWLALTWAGALACIQGLVLRGGAFLRTPKFRERQGLKQAAREAKGELALALVLSAGAVAAAASGPGADAVFLAALCGWGAVVFGAAPVTAFVAARADLRSAALRERRRLESIGARVPLYRRPSSYAAIGATTVVLIVILGSSLTVQPGSNTFGGLLEEFAIPRRQAQAAADAGQSPSGGLDTRLGQPASPAEEVGPLPGESPSPTPGARPSPTPPGVPPSPGETVAPQPATPPEPPAPTGPPTSPEPRTSPGPPASPGPPIPPGAPTSPETPSAPSTPQPGAP
jgi:cellulose synthase/poly-beta-1,6-N-acetylglucosamine synthase-like glycosyltransferase